MYAPKSSLPQTYRLLAKLGQHTVPGTTAYCTTLKVHLGLCWFTIITIYVTRNVNPHMSLGSDVALYKRDREAFKYQDIARSHVPRPTRLDSRLLVAPLLLVLNINSIHREPRKNACSLMAPTGSGTASVQD